MKYLTKQYLAPVLLVLLGFAITFQSVSLNNKWAKQTSLEEIVTAAQEENDEENAGHFKLCSDGENTCEEDNTNTGEEEEDAKKNSDHTFDLSISFLQLHLIFFNKYHTLSSHQDICLLPPEQC